MEPRQQHPHALATILGCAGCARCHERQARISGDLCCSILPCALGFVKRVHARVHRSACAPARSACMRQCARTRKRITYARHQVWFDTENNSQTLFSGSKDSAWQVLRCRTYVHTRAHTHTHTHTSFDPAFPSALALVGLQRFNELKAQCSCSPSESRNLMAHVEIAPTDGFPIVLGQPVRDVPHERVADGRPCELRPRVPSESEAAASAAPLTLFAGRLDEHGPGAERETEPEDEDSLIFSRGAAQDCQAAGAEMCAAAVSHADSDEEPLLFSRGAGRTQR